MNTRDNDIELPPNPITPMLAALIDKASGTGTAETIWQLMQEFARQAIEADRKRMGEPVGYINPSHIGQGHGSGVFWAADKNFSTPVYAPQPALDAADLAFIVDELRKAGEKRAADMVMQAMPHPTLPAEPTGDSVWLKECLRTLTAIEEGRFDEANIDGQSGQLAAEQANHNSRHLRKLLKERANQPVNVPSDAQETK